MRKHYSLFILVLGLICSFSFAQEPPTGPSFSILTFNTFDAFFGPDRAERMAALPEAIMALEPLPDVIVLTEAFKADHRALVVEGLKRRGYPLATVHYQKSQYGTGILLISRFALETVAEFTPYRVDGALFDPEHYAGKGVQHYRLATPQGPLELFATHPIARFKPLYTDQGQHQDRDRKTNDRLLEMEQISRVIMKQADPAARSIILAGDLNVSPDMWEYQYLLARTALTDSFAFIHPDLAAAASTYSPDNTFVDREWFRIDHILFKDRPGTKGFWIKPVKSDIVFRQPIALAKGKPANLSDHFGLFTVFAAISDPAGVAMSPGFRPERSAGTRSPGDFEKDGLRLTPDNYLAWQSWAVEALDRIDRRYDRFSPAVIPAARIVIAGQVQAPTVVPLSSWERMALQAQTKKSSQ